MRNLGDYMDEKAWRTGQIIELICMVLLPFGFVAWVLSMVVSKKHRGRWNNFIKRGK